MKRQTRKAVTLRLPVELLARLDKWRSSQPVLPSKTAAIEAAISTFIAKSKGK
jgi:hypothetical protein